jgi:hypothetical protein
MPSMGCEQLQSREGGHTKNVSGLSVIFSTRLNLYHFSAAQS